MRPLSTLFEIAWHPTMCLLINHPLLNKWPDHFSDFKHLWSTLNDKLKKIKLEMIVVTLRNIWFHRNDFIFNDNFLTSNSLLQKAYMEIDTFHTANKATHKVPKCSSDSKWSPPNDSFFKALWDPAIDSKGKKLEFRIACLCSLQPFYLQPILAESLALWRTTEFCLEQVLRHLILEGDSLIVVKVVKHEKHDWSWYKGLIGDIKYIFLQSTALKYFFCYPKREL